MVENIGIVKVGISHDDLTQSIMNLGLLKPLLQKILESINSDGLGKEDAAAVAKDLDTAITAMTMLLSGFPEYQN